VDLFRIIFGALRLINDTFRNPYLSSDLDVKLGKMGRESIFGDTMDWTVPGSGLSRLLLAPPAPAPAEPRSIIVSHHSNALCSAGKAR
jgi:hypothetical protein